MPHRSSRRWACWVALALSLALSLSSAVLLASCGDASGASGSALQVDADRSFVIGYAGAPPPNGNTSSTNTACIIITNTGTDAATNVRVAGTIYGATESFSGADTIAPQTSEAYTSTAYFGPSAAVEIALPVSIRVTMGDSQSTALTWQGTIKNPFNKFTCTAA